MCVVCLRSRLGVLRKAVYGCLGVYLLRAVDNPFVRVVVRVHEKSRPAFGQRVTVHSVSVVLRGDVAARSTHVNARLIHRTVSVLHLVRLRARGERQELVAEADPENGHLPPHGPFHRLDGGLALERKGRKGRKGRKERKGRKGRKERKERKETRGRKERKERKGVLAHAVDGCRRPQETTTRTTQQHNMHTLFHLHSSLTMVGSPGPLERKRPS